MTWSDEQLSAFAQANDFHVAPYRADGKTLGTPTYIWSVVTDGGLFIRAYSGQGSSWYQAALSQKEGQIELTGETFDVAFEPVASEALNDRIDEAYKSKYADSSYLTPMISDRARGATVQVKPR